MLAFPGLSCDLPESVGISCSTALLKSRREVIFEYWDSLTYNNPILSNLVSSIRKGPEDTFLQFLLDCSAVEEVLYVEEYQEHGTTVFPLLFKL